MLAVRIRLERGSMKHVVMYECICYRNLSRFAQFVTSGFWPLIIFQWYLKECVESGSLTVECFEMCDRSRFLLYVILWKDLHARKDSIGLYEKVGFCFQVVECSNESTHHCLVMHSRAFITFNIFYREWSSAKSVMRKCGKRLILTEEKQCCGLLDRNNGHFKFG